METEKSARGTERDPVEFDHGMYGVVPGGGSGTKAFPRGLDAGLYDPYLRGHYTPIRAAIAQSSDDPIDLHMMHPVRTGRDLLLSRITRGPPDEAGRPTFANHTVVARGDVLPSRRVTLDAVYTAISEFDRKAPHALGEMAPLKIRTRPQEEGPPPFGARMPPHLTFPA